MEKLNIYFFFDYLILNIVKLLWFLEVMLNEVRLILFIKILRKFGIVKIVLEFILKGYIE